MRSLTCIRGLGLCCLLAAGCGKSAGISAGIQSEAERKAAEESARIQRFEELIGNGEKALEAKRFEEAVMDFEEAVRHQTDPRARELLQQAHKARLNGLWVLSRQEGRDSSFTVKGLAKGLLFEQDKVMDVFAMNGVVTGKGTSGPYQLDVSKDPKTIDIRWN